MFFFVFLYSYSCVFAQRLLSLPGNLSMVPVTSPTAATWAALLLHLCLFHSSALVGTSAGLSLHTIPPPPWQTLPPAYPLMSQALKKGRPSSLTDFAAAAAAAAKSLQSCPTLCDPIDSSPSGSSIHGILQAETPETPPSSRAEGLLFLHPLDHRKSKRVPEKHLFLLY